MKNKTVGFSVTGSFCTLAAVLPIIAELSKHNKIIPIISNSVASFDTRFYRAEDFLKDLKLASKNENIITTIVDAEKIGPANNLDIMVIAPATGNTLAKLAYGITDTPVLMATKATLRNNKPVLISPTTNDALSNGAKNLGILFNSKNIYTVPIAQDSPNGKPFSAVAQLDMLIPALELALGKQQIQPIYI
ncbi:MAG: dipicolinate synthase subunit B [Firmicutes bacterium]|nr:dipicolinate synthase subunit B [Bacillota bacterium]MCL1953798.1 dipicolinate synthase subunit B [Bacillota bacterium]